MFFHWISHLLKQELFIWKAGYLREEGRERVRISSFIFWLTSLMVTITKARSGLNQEPGTLSGPRRGGKNSGMWVMSVWCISMKQDQEWSDQDLNGCSERTGRHPKWSINWNTTTPSSTSVLKCRISKVYEK